MEKNDVFTDDFLAKLLQDSSLESPSDDFVDGVMTKINEAPVMVPVQKSFFLFLKNSWQYALIAFAVIVFLLTSDLPFSNIIPGKEYFTRSLLPYISSIFPMIKSSFGSLKNISVPLMIITAAGFLLLMDYLLFRKPKLQNLMLV
jgi:hypothetical protein